ncbi:MAG: hypothetical protein LBP59_12335 [Planctomycetaceae bacterium]|nr:hypothetical protein [Planctomycetaceae bacterium]
MYSTADERGLDRNSLFVCLAANCRRDACDPSQIFVTKNLISFLCGFKKICLYNLQLARRFIEIQQEEISKNHKFIFINHRGHREHRGNF